MSKSTKIIGIILSLIGLALCFVYLLVSFEESVVLLIYGIPLVIIGLIVFFNKREDRIEQIKQTGGKNGKK